MTYTFKAQLKQGKRGEAILDLYHATKYHITPATMAQERRGIDRVMSRNGRSWRVEYKTDFLSQRYGNIMIETISNDVTGKPGWALTSESDFIVYLMFGLDETLYFRTAELKRMVSVWRKQYGELGIVPNKGYNSVNIKLPVPEARLFAFFKVRGLVAKYGRAL